MGDHPAQDKVVEVSFADVRKVATPQGSWKVNWLMLDAQENRWSRSPDLNRRPVDYESTALPTELLRPLLELNNPL
jgi:hypothetical protein